jgi:hypothetical protein
MLLVFLEVKTTAFLPRLFIRCSGPGAYYPGRPAGRAQCGRVNIGAPVTKPDWIYIARIPDCHWSGGHIANILRGYS